MRWRGQWKTIMNAGSVSILSLAWQRSAFKGMTAWQSYSLLLLALNRSSKGRFCFCAKESGTCVLHIGVLVALCLAPPAPQVFLVAPLLYSYSTSLTLFKSWHGSASVLAVIVGLVGSPLVKGWGINWILFSITILSSNDTLCDDALVLSCVINLAHAFLSQWCALPCP